MKLTIRSETPPGEKLPYYQIGLRRYPSVTTILGVLAKPALVQWAANQAAEKALDWAETVWDRKSPIGIGTLNEWKRAFVGNKDSAADIGTWTHLLMDSLLGGTKLRVPFPGKKDGTEQRLRKAAESAMRELKMKPIAPGALVYDRKNEYAGTFDAIVSIKGRPALVDWKTSSDVYPEYHLQTAAYLGALLSQKPQRTTVPARAILRLDKRAGAWDLVYAPSALIDDLAVFLAVKQVYNWKSKGATWRRGA